MANRIDVNKTTRPVQAFGWTRVYMGQVKEDEGEQQEDQALGTNW